jgi:hypothetical protein
MSPTIYRPAWKPPRNYNRLRITIAVVLVGLVGLAASGALEARPLKARVVYGSAKSLGNGTARVFVTLDEHKKPATIGVAITESAMSGLPTTPIPPSPSAASLTLDLPKEANGSGYDHVMLDWNPNGHEPDHVYTHPHFDFHFYTISQKEQMDIVPTAPDFEKRASRVPDAKFAPPGYVAANALMNASAPAATVPTMGLHWIDGAAHELHGRTFTTTFLWGSYDGKFIFIEPMITKAYIESAKSAPSNELVMPLTAPGKYQHAGYYPSSYAVRYDAAAKEYRISLDGLHEQK